MRIVPTLTRTVSVDIESFWSQDFTLSKLSVSEYVRDPRFKIHCAAIAISGRKTRHVWGHDAVGDHLRAIDWTTHALLCQNTQFDGFALAHCYGIVPCFYFDTKSMAAGLLNGVVSNSLESLAHVYGVGVKDDSSLQSTKGLADIPEEWRERFAQYNIDDAEQCLAIFKQQKKVFPATELHIIDHVIRMFCDSPLEVDIEMCREALSEETLWRRSEMLKAKRVFATPGTEEYESFDIESLLLSDAKFGEALSDFIDPPTKRSGRVPGKINWAFSLTDEDFLDLQHSEILEVALLVRARIAAKSTQSESRALRMLEAGRDGQKLPVGYTYSAAKTHRLGGNNKMNLQNVQRGSKLRRSIKAPPGHVLVTVDSAQIELRTNCQVCKQEDVLELLRQKKDVYRVGAAEMFSTPESLITPEQRFIAKIRELGLGYNMGHKKYQTTLALGTMGPPLYLPLGECLTIVNYYRGTHLQIVAGWAEGDRILRAMIAGGEGTAFDGLIRYEPGSVWLPNGLPIHYPNLHFNADGDIVYSVIKGKGAGRRVVTQKIYGGKFMENLIQALARIIVFDQLLMIADYLATIALKPSEVARVVMTTHDEITACVPARIGATVLKKMLAFMRVPPPFAPTIPLDAEGDLAPYYCK